MPEANINHHVSIRCFKNIKPTIGARVFVDPASVVIGDVVLGDDCSVWPCVVIRGDDNMICIGDRTNIQDGSVLHVSDPDPLNPNAGSLQVGSDVTIGHGVNLHGCCIGNAVIIGIGSIVLDAAVIEDNVILAAGSLVPPGKTLKSGYLYKGSPCKEIRKLDEEERLSIINSSVHYVKTKNVFN